MATYSAPPVEKTTKLKLPKYMHRESKKWQSCALAHRLSLRSGLTTSCFTHEARKEAIHAYPRTPSQSGVDATVSRTRVKHPNAR